MTSLKLIERKVPKDKIAMLSIPMIPVKIIITIFLTRYQDNDDYDEHDEGDEDDDDPCQDHHHKN